MLAPIDGQTEVWAAGVTYKRSEEARVEESATPDIYSRVYRAERPELFFKANARRVAGPDAPVVVRSDSTWDVPEPEVAIVVNARGEIVGYTIGNDVSSRSIEGENPLYLPQAKVYAGSCALGPGITPAWEVADPYALGIRMRIERGGAACTGRARRACASSPAGWKTWSSYLFREDDVPRRRDPVHRHGAGARQPVHAGGGRRRRDRDRRPRHAAQPVVRGKGCSLAERSSCEAYRGLVTCVLAGPRSSLASPQAYNPSRLREPLLSSEVAASSSRCCWTAAGFGSCRVMYGLSGWRSRNSRTATGPRCM